MNTLKAKPIGIDKPIEGFQTFIYESLKKLWGVDDASFNMYARAYKNQTKTGYIPEVYVGNSEYNDSYFDDTLSASAFFGVGETIQVTKETVNADVYLIFMVNLAKIKALPDTTRNDEEARTDVQKLCSDLSLNVTGYVTGIANVFKEYDIEQIKFRDTHPLHCFRINFKLIYNIFNC